MDSHRSTIRFSLGLRIHCHKNRLRFFPALGNCTGKVCCGRNYYVGLCPFGIPSKASFGGRMETNIDLWFIKYYHIPWLLCHCHATCNCRSRSAGYRYKPFVLTTKATIELQRWKQIWQAIKFLPKI